MKQSEYGSGYADLTQSVDRALELLKKGDMAEAQSEFLFILQNHYDSSIAEFGIKVTKFWQQRDKRIQNTSEGYDRGVLLLELWPKFEEFYRTLRGIDDRIVSVLRYFVFTQALEQLNKDANTSKRINAKMLYMVAMAYKKIGDYQNAMTAFEQLFCYDINDSDVLAQLADVYVLRGQSAYGKVLYREAFKDNPDGIHLENIESDEFVHLTELVRNEEPGIDERTLLYWIPVYGRIYHILNISREMTPGDYMKLKKRTIALERELSQTLEYDSILTARLLNNYFLLYDYYRSQADEKVKRDEIENNIKKIAYNIYILFKKNDQEIR